jgi:hypothetical protein
MICAGRCRLAQVCERARNSQDRLQNHPPIRDERHEQAQHDAQNSGRDLAILHVHPDEHEALDRESNGCQDRQLRLPMERGGDDEPDRAHQLYDAKAFRGNAPNDGTSLLTLSNMNTFITPDDP